MAEKPVMLMKTPFTKEWRAVLTWKEMGEGVFNATSSRPIHEDSARQLDEITDSHSWLQTLLTHSGKTREEIAATFGLSIT